MAGARSSPAAGITGTARPSPSKVRDFKTTDLLNFFHLKLKTVSNETQRTFSRN